MSSDIAMALRHLPDEIVPPGFAREVSSCLSMGVANSDQLEGFDFALVWLLDAFFRREWGDDGSLKALLPLLPGTSIARRELLMATRGSGDQSEFNFVPGNKWLERGRARLHHVPHLRSARQGSGALAFETALMDAIRSDAADKAG
jgi:hypothetical protein